MNLYLFLAHLCDVCYLFFYKFLLYLVYYYRNCHFGYIFVLSMIFIIIQCYGNNLIIIDVRQRSIIKSNLPLIKLLGDQFNIKFPLFVSLQQSVAYLHPVLENYFVIIFRSR